MLNTESYVVKVAVHSTLLLTSIKFVPCRGKQLPLSVLHCDDNYVTLNPSVLFNQVYFRTGFIIGFNYNCNYD